MGCKNVHSDILFVCKCSCLTSFWMFIIHKSEEIRNAVNIFNTILSPFMSSLHVLEKLSVNIGHLSCIYYLFLACKRLLSVLLKIEMD